MSESSMKFDRFVAIAKMAEAMKRYDETETENFTWRQLARVAYEALEEYKGLTEDNVEAKN